MNLIHLIKLFILAPLLTVSSSDLGKLPFCSGNSGTGLALVSTIDGRLSAINSDGILQWQIDTGPGSLLTSNIHNLELTNNGKWVRIIPSLTGSLYRFDGNTVDAIPISAESLLKSSFKYSDDLVIAGGLEVTTYGIGLKTGKVFYTCSSVRCSNDTTDNGNEVDDILLIERSTQTVRAIEPHSGNERWNFSVGNHNVKLPLLSCIDPNINLFNWNLTAIIPDGMLIASSFQDNVEITWQYHFPSPIVRIWKWNGYQLTEIDLFSTKRVKDPENSQSYSPAIYLGMHRKQLYIHESDALQRRSFGNAAITESASLVKIPWRPVSASGLLTEEDSTALSVLYSSEYVNGHGYYLFSESDLTEKDHGLCDNNNTLKYPAIVDKSGTLNVILWCYFLVNGAVFFVNTLIDRKEIVLVMVTTSVVYYVMFKSLIKTQDKQNVVYVERRIPVPVIERMPSERSSESSDAGFSSRYMNDFDTLRCLGKGGFGIVFEAKQKIDECHYAIKRIILPNDGTKRDAVMREVKALAKLDHNNIVRYFNSWVEKPPHGWQQEHDQQWLSDITESGTNPATTTVESSNYNNLLSKNSRESEKSTIPKRVDDTNDSFIVFADDSRESEEPNCAINHTSDLETSKTQVSWYLDNDKSSESKTEQSSTSSLQNVVTTSDPDAPPVYLYIQMQLCQKESLKEWLSNNQERHYPSVLDIFKQIVSAVEYVHLQGLIHRDLKPSNIFFSLNGQIKVGDFGLVKDVQESIDMQKNSSPYRGHTKEVGTRLYMSPEQLKGKKYNYKVDIYSLGLIFYELLEYFDTDMERIQTLMKLRENEFPQHFPEKHPDEYKLLTLMLCRSPEKRPTTFGIRVRPPLSCQDSESRDYDFELPPTPKTSISLGFT